MSRTNDTHGLITCDDAAGPFSLIDRFTYSVCNANYRLLMTWETRRCLVHVGCLIVFVFVSEICFFLHVCVSSGRNSGSGFFAWFCFFVFFLLIVWVYWFIPVVGIYHVCRPFGMGIFPCLLYFFFFSNFPSGVVVDFVSSFFSLPSMSVISVLFFGGGGFLRELRGRSESNNFCLFFFTCFLRVRNNVEGEMQINIPSQ
ncbi:hypothetical protein DM02DRAFT_171211 [Periconia macrospinosa]|uniref:Uncharacterized protein n=1 Tax=Periconia macrospinosa TaxID=97972 RepID=A0A2V1DAB6_9PLEO|nr:hypothetical protein DM02DRAFT_171211 [Periconia macrospinosa]